MGSIIQLAVRLGLAFMVEVTSSLLFEDPDSVFDEERLIDEPGSDGASAPGRRGRIEGTTELGAGIGKHMRGAEGRRTEILLKTKGVWRRTPLGLGRLGVVVVTVLGRNEAVQYISRSRSE